GDDPVVDVAQWDLSGGEEQVEDDGRTQVGVYVAPSGQHPDEQGPGAPLEVLVELGQGGHQEDALVRGAGDVPLRDVVAVPGEGEGLRTVETLDPRVEVRPRVAVVHRTSDAHSRGAESIDHRGQALKGR